MTETNLAHVLHSLDADTRVELFKLDATALGGDIHYFTTTKTDTPLVFNTISYPYVGAEANGFETNGRGSLPEPTITVSNINSIFNGLVIQYGDLLGAVVTRTRTFARFLDNGSQPDTSAYLPQDVYRIEQKTQHDKTTIVWKLSALLDQEGRKLPKRQILRDTCLHTYRVWNATTGAFDYTNASCPYTGTNYFDAAGNATTDPSKDKCGKRLSDDKLRFGTDGELPTRAFPGIAGVS